MKGSHKAFSVLELLLVMVIVLIIAAILFPVFVRPRRHGNGHTSCASNLKQLNLAFAQYLQDYDMKYPAGQGTHRGSGWAGAVYPYVKSTGVYLCSEETPSGDTHANPPRYSVSYAFNQLLAQTDKETVAGNTYSGLGTVSAKMTDPSKTILLFEVSGSQADITDPLEGASMRDRTSLAGNGVNLETVDGGNTEHVADMRLNGAQYATGHTLGWDQTAQTAQWADSPRHEGSANYALADGHVKAVSPQRANAVQDTLGSIYWAQK